MSVILFVFYLYCLCSTFLFSSTSKGETFESQHQAEALELTAEKKWVEATIALKNILKKNSPYGELHEALARSLTYSGRRQEALLLYQQWLEHATISEKNTLLRRAQTLSRIFYTQSTQQLYQEGLELIFSKKFQLAREKLEKALSIETDNVEILMRLGQTLTLSNDYDSAAEKFRLARQLYPWDEHISLWLGKALFERGEQKEGLQLLKAATESPSTQSLGILWYLEALSHTDPGLETSATALKTLEKKYQKIFQQIQQKTIPTQKDQIFQLLTLSRFRLQNEIKVDETKKILQSLVQRIEQFETDPQKKTLLNSTNLISEAEFFLDLTPSPQELKVEALNLLKSSSQNNSRDKTTQALPTE